mmetsp:Transcript_145471/g.466201  ORF Transcript_145471/g.466201 Transcript_145471/m.466201 type:complete len:200 (+) Transcript_145471:1244-1843(+)
MTVLRVWGRNRRGTGNACPSWCVSRCEKRWHQLRRCRWPLLRKRWSERSVLPASRCQWSVLTGVMLWLQIHFLILVFFCCGRVACFAQAMCKSCFDMFHRDCSDLLRRSYGSFCNNRRPLSHLHERMRVPAHMLHVGCICQRLLRCLLWSLWGNLHKKPFNKTALSLQLFLLGQVFPNFIFKIKPLGNSTIHVLGSLAG